MSTSVMAKLKEPVDRFMVLSLGLLSVRVIQGFIYWGGGSRRFIYGTQKINPNSAHWMANKFQTAMPGALLGLEHVISFMLQHFWLLYAGIIIFSAAELFVGAFLMIGLFTRISAFISMIFSVLLMLMFGWQGATCIDEWTMAACNLAMGATIFLCGSPHYAVDNIILRKHPSWEKSWLFRWCGGSLPVPLNDGGYKKLALWTLLFVVVFDIGTYHHYRGSVVTWFHSGPVSPTKHHISLDSGVLNADGSVSFHAYLDAGTPEAPMSIMEAWLINRQGQKIAHWDTAMLSAIPVADFKNDYAYNKFKPALYGIDGEVGAKATISLPAIVSPQKDDLPVTLRLINSRGTDFSITLK
ncbi:TPA: TQO small subunit DoxD [Salmonella enterica subsp. diarizonae serovar 50:k:z35]